MKNEQKNNAYINYSKHGDFNNLHMTLTLNDGKVVKCHIRIVCYDKNIARKLNYKVIKGLDEYVVQK